MNYHNQRSFDWEGRQQDLIAAEAEYGFLIGRLLDRETLRQAILTAESWGVSPLEVLLARGWVTDVAYVEALADYLGVPALGQFGAELPDEAILIDATCRSPGQVARQIAERESAGGIAVIATAREMEERDSSEREQWRLKRAIAGLLRWRPVLSAGAPTWTWQLITASALSGLVAGVTTVAPDAGYRLLLVLLTLVFLPVVVLRVVVTALGLMPQRSSDASARLADADLPTYSILVPMFREAQVLPDLVAAISALDYPAAKLDVLLILESVDLETQDIARSIELPGFMRTIVVPDSQPRTKPKALNYALQFARGDYVVVYDAEDMPEPDQLRLAIATFREAPRGTICLQGQLNIHNARESWLTRQFALEYSALFDVTLPGLARLGLPIPLGGTSNHFPREVLDRWFGWDPFNVTEDADLGIRLARTGGRIGVLNSTTWEEAPARFGIWLRQRTRWMKGWMQTYLVHTRQPVRLMRELGFAAFVGFHLYSGGLILSALVFPLFCGMAAFEAWHGGWLMLPESLSGGALWTLTVFELAAAYASSVLAAGVAAWRRGRKWLAFRAPIMPVYWLLISVAAYRALFQLATAPHFWEKTEHRSRTRSRKP